MIKTCVEIVKVVATSNSRCFFKLLKLPRDIERFLDKANLFWDAVSSMSSMY